MRASQPAAAGPVAVVVLNYNGLDDTLKCLASLRALADPARVILVDNASVVDPTGPAREAYPGIDTLRTSVNLGYAGGNNRGIELALAQGAEWILILNNDTVVEPHIVRDLLAAFASDSTLGIVGPVVNFMEEPEAVMTDGVAFNPGPGTEFFQRIVVPVQQPPTLVPVDIVNGCCMMVKAEVFRKVGMFDEAFFIVHEESDLCLRTQRAGFACAVLGKSLVWHKGSSSFDRSGRQLQRYFDARNLWHLLKRHTGRVGRSRGLLVSTWHYLRYAFYRYDIELDAGKTAAADAVMDGVIDGSCGRFGPYQPRKGPGRAPVRLLFAGARRLARVRR
ncbi:MAG: glycosyltransferase family 2 protein [Acidobacteriota bacterium]